MTEKLTTMNVNMVILTENIINITTTMNINGWIWPKIKNRMNMEMNQVIMLYFQFLVKFIHFLVKFKG